MLTIVLVKLTEKELEVLDVLRAGTQCASRSTVLRQALIAMARKRHAISALEAVAIAADRDENHRERRRPLQRISIHKKGRK